MQHFFWVTRCYAFLALIKGYVFWVTSWQLGIIKFLSSESNASILKLSCLSVLCVHCTELMH